MTSRNRVLVAAPLAVATLLFTAACGSDDATAGPTPQSGTPTTAASSPTSTPTPSESSTPTQPLSEFEDVPAVKTLRRFAFLLGKAIPARDARLHLLDGVLVGEAMTEMRSAVKTDMGNDWPGPLPFTPVKVNVSGSRAKIDICFQTHGWSLDPKTHAPVEPDRKVIPAQMWLRKTGSRWVIDGYYISPVSCSGVPVKGVAW